MRVLILTVFLLTVAPAAISEVCPNTFVCIGGSCSPKTLENCVTSSQVRVIAPGMAGAPPIPDYSAAGSQANATATPYQATPARTALCAENGSCYGDISTITGRPKTTHVEGYFRRDGTYVRGHYRSR